MIQIRQMRYQDLPQVLTIDRECHTFPWTQGMFADSFRQHRCYVMELDTIIVGFYIFQFLPGKIAEILDICISPSYQDRKLGNQLLTFLIQQVQEEGAKEIILEVRRSNFKAFNFYKKHGFEQTGFRKNYYLTEEGREDGLLMTLVLE